MSLSAAWEPPSCSLHSITRWTLSQVSKLSVKNIIFQPQTTVWHYCRVREGNPGAGPQGGHVAIREKLENPGVVGSSLACSRPEATSWPCDREAVLRESCTWLYPMFQRESWAFLRTQILYFRQYFSHPWHTYNSAPSCPRTSKLIKKPPICKRDLRKRQSKTGRGKKMYLFLSSMCTFFTKNCPGLYVRMFLPNQAPRGRLNSHPQQSFWSLLMLDYKFQKERGDKHCHSQVWWGWFTMHA